VRGRLTAVAVSCLGSALLAGCGQADGHASAGSSSDPQRAVALAAAHREQKTVTGTFLVATYRPDAGYIAQTNTGHRCTRGHTLEVRLLWKDDASFTHGGVVGAPPDGPHKALLLTVNVPSGDICVVGASYADDDPRPGEIYLYGPRQDLVPSSTASFSVSPAGAPTG
jgi:hypothetical protein